MFTAVAESCMPAAELIFYEPTRWDILGRLICLVTKSRFCHVAIRYGHSIIEAVPFDGVVVREATLNDELQAYRSIELDDQHEIQDWLGPVLGIQYGYLDLVGLLVHVRFSSRAMTCGELASNFVRTLGTPPEKYRAQRWPQDLSTPARLAQLYGLE